MIIYCLVCEARASGRPLLSNQTAVALPFLKIHRFPSTELSRKKRFSFTLCHRESSMFSIVKRNCRCYSLSYTPQFAVFYSLSKERLLSVSLYRKSLLSVSLYRKSLLSVSLYRKSLLSVSLSRKSLLSVTQSL